MRTGLNAPRSRSGCQECRRRRKKCDQVKPSCGLCQRTGKTCNYERELSWGGRPFGKSIFGQYSGNLTALKGDDGSKGFVYAPVASPTKKNAAKDKKQQAQSSRQGQASFEGQFQLADTAEDEDAVEEIPRSAANIPCVTQKALDLSRTPIPWELSPTPNLDYLNFLKVPWKSLLDHFVSVTSMSLSLHCNVQDVYNSALVPRAFERPGLMAALLLIAGQNRHALMMEQSEEDLEGLKAISVTDLRSMLSHRPAADNSEDLALATVLCLCIADIVSGGERPGSWRTHLRGAAAMLESIDARSVGPGIHTRARTPLQDFLRKWYLSIEATTLLGSILEDVPPGYQTALRLSYDLGPSFISEYLGFPPYLLRVFGDITKLAVEACKARNAPIDPDADTDDPSQLSALEAAAAQRTQQAFALLAEVDQKGRRGPTQASSVALISPTIAGDITAAQHEDFLALNECFHHTTAIHIHRRILFTPTRSPLVQLRVKAIIRLVSPVKFVRGPGPAVAFLLPLFAAGCEAVERADQEAIERVLWQMRVCFGMGDVREATNLLKEIWKRRDEGRESEVEWETLSAELGIDLLIY